MTECVNCAKFKGCDLSSPNVNECADYKEILTNDEWLRSCTTEQLAEYILNVWLDGALNVNAEFGLNEAQIEKHKGYIVEWLKQPHQKEVSVEVEE